MLQKNSQGHHHPHRHHNSAIRRGVKSGDTTVLSRSALSGSHRSGSDLMCNQTHTLQVWATLMHRERGNDKPSCHIIQTAGGHRHDKELHQRDSGSTCPDAINLNLSKSLLYQTSPSTILVSSRAVGRESQIDWEMAVAIALPLRQRAINFGAQCDYVNRHPDTPSLAWKRSFGGKDTHARFTLQMRPRPDPPRHAAACAFCLLACTCMCRKETGWPRPLWRHSVSSSCTPFF